MHNAGRSQMAAALLDHHANGQVTVRSAGSDPAERLNPAVVEAIAEWVIDLSQEVPKQDSYRDVAAVRSSPASRPIPGRATHTTQKR